jgi:hypothetical protein
MLYWLHNIYIIILLDVLFLLNFEPLFSLFHCIYIYHGIVCFFFFELAQHSLYSMLTCLSPHMHILRSISSILTKQVMQLFMLACVNYLPKSK